MTNDSRVVTDVRKVSSMNPSQWEGTTANDGVFYARYRHDVFTASVGRDMNDDVSAHPTIKVWRPPVDGVSMSTETMKALCEPTFTFDLDDDPDRPEIETQEAIHG